MSQFKDIFISYGRKESLIQAALLHQNLCLNGLEVWFDKVNIPSGDDYLERIKAGIRDAQSFVFFLAPHSLTSEYCLGELEYAVDLGKRIFPFMHIEETPDITATYTQKQEEVREKILACLGRRDWLMGREKLGNINELHQWKLSYENSWHQHLKPEYLQNWVPSIRWGNIDKIEEITVKLIQEIRRDERYVLEHTKLLYAAFEWERKGKLTKDLLVGNDRNNAEKWLLEDFKGEIPPCNPTQLHAQFIVASKKNAENLMTEAFISYAIPNRDVMLVVNNALERQNISTWVHFFDIDKTKQYAKEIEIGIEEANNFLFFISKNSLASTWCLEELKYAFKLNKRVIPILIEPIENYNWNGEIAENNQAIKQLLTLQFVDFTDNISDRVDTIGKTDFERDIDDIVREIKRDDEYYSQHKIFLAQALRWKKRQLPSFLLRGYNLENAERWLSRNIEKAHQPPLPIHEEYIKSSKTNKGILPTDVFISYSRKDADFARKLNRKLQESGRVTWFDQESIASGLDFDQEIFEGIKKTFNFLFIISPDSIASTFCEEELLFAAEHEKRFIPLLVTETLAYTATLPPAYKNIQWVDFSDLTTFDKAFHDLEILLDTDIDHVRYHTELQQRAIEWENNQRKEDYLLNESAANHALEWLKESEDRKPKATGLQKEYIENSEQHILWIQKEKIQTASKLKTRLRISQVAIVIGIILLGVAGYYIYESNRLYKHSKQLDERADRNRQKAVELEAAAKVLENKAQKALEAAAISKKEAIKANEEASEAAKEAKLSNDNAQQANRSAKMALRKQYIADQAQRVARMEQHRAEEGQDRALKISEKEKAKAQSYLLGITAEKIVKEDPSTALRLLKTAWDNYANLEVKGMLYNLVTKNELTERDIPYHKIIKKNSVTAKEEELEKYYAENNKKILAELEMLISQKEGDKMEDLSLDDDKEGFDNMIFNNHSRVTYSSNEELLRIDFQILTNENLKTGKVNWEMDLSEYPNVDEVIFSNNGQFIYLFYNNKKNLQIIHNNTLKKYLNISSDNELNHINFDRINSSKENQSLENILLTYPDRLEYWDLSLKKLRFSIPTEFSNTDPTSFEFSQDYLLFKGTIFIIQQGDGLGFGGEAHFRGEPMIYDKNNGNIIYNFENYEASKSIITANFHPINTKSLMLLIEDHQELELIEWDIKKEKYISDYLSVREITPLSDMDCQLHSFSNSTTNGKKRAIITVTGYLGTLFITQRDQQFEKINFDPTLTDIKISDNNDYFLNRVSEEDRIDIYDLNNSNESYKLTKVNELYHQGVRSATIDLHSNYLISSGTNTNAVKIFEFNHNRGGNNNSVSLSNNKHIYQSLPLDLNYTLGYPLCVVSEKNGTISFWDQNTNILVAQSKTAEKNDLGFPFIKHSFFEVQERYYISSFHHHTINIFEYDSFKKREAITFQNNITDIDFSPWKELLIAATGNEIQIWNTKNMMLQSTIIDQKQINKCWFIDDGRKIMAEQNDTIKIWDANSLEKLKTINQAFLAKIEQKEVLITSSNKNTISFWDYENLNKRLTTKIDGEIKEIVLSEDQNMMAVKLLPQNDLFGKHSPIILFRINTESDQFICDHISTISGRNILFINSEKVIIYGNRHCRLYDVKTEGYLSFIPENKNKIEMVVLSPNKDILVFLYENNTMVLCDVSTQKILMRFRLEGKVNNLKFSPDGNYFTTQYIDNNSITKWNTSQYVLSWVGENVPEINEDRYKSLNLDFMLEE